MKNNTRTDKEEENKLAGALTRKELPTEGCSRKNGKGEGSSRQKKISNIIDNFMINCLYEDTKRKAEKRLEWRMLTLQ